MKFKVGDKVELIKTSGMSARKGAVGIVYSYDNPNYVGIMWVDKPGKGKRRGQEDGGYYEKDFQLLEEDSMEFLIRSIVEELT